MWIRCAKESTKWIVPIRKLFTTWIWISTDNPVSFCNSKLFFRYDKNFKQQNIWIGRQTGRKVPSAESGSATLTDDQSLQQTDTFYDYQDYEEEVNYTTTTTAATTTSTDPSTTSTTDAPTTTPSLQKLEYVVTICLFLKNDFNILFSTVFLDMWISLRTNYLRQCHRRRLSNLINIYRTLRPKVTHRIHRARPPGLRWKTVRRPRWPKMRTCSDYSAKSKPTFRGFTNRIRPNPLRRLC